VRVAVPHTAGRGGARVCSASAGFQAGGNSNRGQLTPDRSGQCRTLTSPGCALACVRRTYAAGLGVEVLSRATSPKHARCPYPAQLGGVWANQILWVLVRTAADARGLSTLTRVGFSTAQ
jgi:hypothetical protein